MGKAIFSPKVQEQLEKNIRKLTKMDQNLNVSLNYKSLRKK